VDEKTLTPVGWKEPSPKGSPGESSDSEDVWGTEMEGSDERSYFLMMRKEKTSAKEAERGGRGKGREDRKKILYEKAKLFTESGLYWKGKIV